MSQPTYRIHGAVHDQTPEALRAMPGVRAARRLIPGHARDGATGELEIASDEIVRVELENGFVLWTRTDDLVREHGQRGLSRDGGEAWEFTALAPLRTPPQAARGERGVLGLGIKVLDFFGVDLAGAAARKLGEAIEEKQLAGNPPGLYRCALNDVFALTPLGDDEAIPIAEGPLLILLHGTMSSCKGGFGKLWEADNHEGRSARERLAAVYGRRVFALEHRTLTESPVANALALARRLPAGVEIHLLSHSRGGLVGELLCLAGCAERSRILTPERLQELFAADRTIAAQLGLWPLNPSAAKERDAAYERDRGLLADLLKELDTKQFRVTRFVRVACPARGTTLASGRLDRWLSMLDFVATRVTGMSILGGSLDFLFAVIKERTDPRTLPGIEAMMPGSALIRLLHHPDLVSQADLSVIAGDIEGDSLWQKLKLVSADWFYGADHDLVVNTGSMSGGLARPDKLARFQKDQGGEVNHFSYFANPRSVRWLVSGLTRADSEDGGFLSLAQAPQEEPRWRGAVARSRTTATPRPLAVVLPGTLGSHLKVEGDHVWLNYWALARGGLRRLRMGKPDIQPGELIDDFYGALLEFLARTHRVEVFAYDWRLSVLDAAAGLAESLEALLPQAERENQPVHLVAHSMGGLVVRAMIADGGRGAAVWQRITRLPKSRFLMLGTPNRGSYEAVRWLTGFNPTEARLSLLDLTQSTKDIIDLVRQYPGLIELLPFAPEGPDFADTARWENIRKTTGADWAVADSETLRNARKTWRRLLDAVADPRTMAYVAGCQRATVVDYQFSDYPLWDTETGTRAPQRIDFIASREGDGTVAWASGALPGVSMWYVEDTAHDALCVQASAFPAYLDLLMTGSTTRLPSTPPARSRAAANEPERFILPAIPPSDGTPDATQLRGLGFGGGLPCIAPQVCPPAPSIEVSVRHGDLSYARHPVLVGHYLGDSIANAEKVLDRQLGGALSRRHDLGIYPGRLDSHALFFNEKPAGKPGGAIVIGLGQVGELTPGLLESGARGAMLNFALQVAQWPDERFGKFGTARKASISCLLVGSGAGGFPVRDAMEAILRSAVAGNKRLVEAQMDGRVTIDRIEFLELYEDVAIVACEALRQILQAGELAGAVRWPAEVLETGQAGLHRVRFDDAAGWWHRLEIVEETERPDILRFIFSTDRARAEETLARGQLALAESFIRDASRSANASPEAARTLYEMLLPQRLKELAPRQSDIILLVDERSARFPWELLEDRWSLNGRPPAVQAGMVRQLKTPEFRARPAHAFEAKALVVGNPDLAGDALFCDLPGARQEAQRVVSMLGSGGFQVEECVDEKADRIVESLHRNAYRVLHLAGHGVHEFPLDNASTALCKRCGQPQPGPQHLISGMVIGRQTILSPGDIEQMRWVPELVFINCCHLGRTGSAPDFDRGALAANLGMQFIRMGVKAVVCAGWAVDDEAAMAFAETFYRHLLVGDPFGIAVREAREEIWKRFPGRNTWGAYQCYGDPSFRLRRNEQGGAASLPPYQAPVELVVELENLARTLQASAQMDDATAKARILATLDRVPGAQRETWLARADVAGALGFAWGETGRWAEGIKWLDKALEAGRGDCPLRVVEQCANYKVRLAAERWLAALARAPADLEQQRLKQVDCIERAILELDILSQRALTEERLNLLGGACKRLALLEATPERRGEALLNMSNYYLKAFELGRRKKAYAFTNWATGQLLAAHLDASLPRIQPAALESDASRVGMALQQRNEEDPNFWDSAGVADIDLMRLIARMLAAEALSPAPAGDDGALTGAIMDGYRNAIQRGASPREKASVIENLAFISEMLGPTPARLADALRQIREAL